ncbi:MAG: RNA methyltransferase [Oxalobacter sp.]|nr:RNA methyltransferase [Oxalobacter sp.]
MAEKHPPSPIREDVSLAQEIAGQARNDGKRLKLSFTVSRQKTTNAMLTKNTIKQIASLRQQKFRKGLGLFVVEGRKMVEELLHSEFETVGLYATEAFLADYPAFGKAEVVSEMQMEQMSGQDTPPGILAVVRIPMQGEIKTSSQLVLAMDGIANPGNMGTLIRTAEWFGIRDVVCSDDCVELWNPKVVQATMGSLFRVKVWKTELAAFLQTAKSEGKAVYGALLEGKNLFQMSEKPDGILVIGSESHGIRAEVLPCITHPITIPRVGGSATESLNAAVAGGILLAEMTKS